ncbi:VapE family protein [Sphingomonas sp. RB3P16]|uniref:VapE domain-containing protein n=1 Tax=Parasphingomonas frigoris TaxID=3096163 RepID=UPI002FC7D9E3
MTFDELSLSAIRPLREAGFALHWLHTKTKRPIGADWSTQPVATLADLQRTHGTGNNTGVRLGEPSKLIDGNYLHAFDIDIRIAELAEEAWEAFADLGLPVDFADLPCVASGSGGESRHGFFVSDRPFAGKMVAHSAGKHRRKVRDVATGETRETWSYDWEIELYGTGKQVVLPPSIHPDTGKAYAWLREFDVDALEFGMGPFIPAAAIESLGAVESAKYDFESREPLDFKPGQLDRVLNDISVSDLDYDDWVRLGQALHHQFGASQEGFDLWLTHTKRSKKFTGDSQIREMRKTKWRSFGKYRGKPVTMGTIVQWSQEARAAAIADEFDDLDDDAPAAAAPIADDEDEFAAALSAPVSDDWDGGADDPAEPMPSTTSVQPMTQAQLRMILEFNDEGGVRPTLHNVEMIVRYDERLWSLAQINEFTQETVQRVAPGVRLKKRKNQAKETRQLAGRVWKVEDTLNGELWSDDRDFAIRSMLEAPTTQGGYGLKVSDRDLRAAIVLAANEHAFHPIREYLGSVQWDGVARVERLWIDYVQATDDCYHRDIARMMMVAAVARVFEPGHKFDFATILEGLQGKGKSTLIEVLGGRWFAELDGDFHDQKQMVELMQGAWIMEIPELTGFGRADVRSIKAFISRRKDRVRLAYARRAGEFPRQCIFIGSTNDREYLKDDTGGRRFWPVQCNLATADEIDIALLRSNVAQLWAEAMSIYRSMRAAQPGGTLPLYLSDPESRVIAARLQESRRLESADDVMAGRIAEWLDKPISTGSEYDDLDDSGKPVYRNEVCTVMVWVECLGGDQRAFKTVEQSTVNRAMAKLEGWEQAGSMRFPVYGKQRVLCRGGEAGRLARMGLGDLLA